MCFGVLGPKIMVASVNGGFLNKFVFYCKYFVFDERLKNVSVSFEFLGTVSDDYVTVL